MRIPGGPAGALQPVADGTIVRLERLDDEFHGAQILATADTTAGRYAFDLRRLDVAYSTSLLVSSDAGPMRAFAVAAVTDIDPITEAVVRVVSQAGAPPPNFVPEEIRELQAGAALLAQLFAPADPPADVATAAAVITQATMTDAACAAYVAAAVEAGATTHAIGDVGNLFPVEGGAQWTFASYSDRYGRDFVASATTRSLADGVVRFEGDAPVFGRSAIDYLKEDERALVSLDADPVAGALPYPLVDFPLTLGGVKRLISGTRLGWRRDFDLDGRDDSATVTIDVTAADLEPVEVAAGRFPAALRLETTTRARIRQSRDGVEVPLVETLTQWLAPGIGPVRRVETTSAFGGSLTDTQDLIGFAVGGRTAGVQPARRVIGQVDTFRLPAAASDGTGYLALACMRDSSDLAGVFIAADSEVSQPFVVATGVCPGEEWPVASNGDGYLVLVNDAGGDGGLYAIAVSAGGQVTGPMPAQRVAPRGTAAAMASDGTNYFVFLADNESRRITGSLLRPDGTVSGSFPITNTLEDVGSPQLLFDGTNYLAMWITRTGIQTLLVSPTGQRLDQQHVVGPHGPAGVGFDGENYLVVWPEVTGGDFDRVTTLYGRPLTPTGAIIGGPAAPRIVVNGSATTSAGFGVTFAGINQLVAWGSSSGIFAARIGSDGSLRDGPATSPGLAIGDVGMFGSAQNVVLASNGSTALLLWMQAKEAEMHAALINGL